MHWSQYNYTDIALAMILYNIAQVPATKTTATLHLSHLTGGKMLHYLLRV